MAPTSILEQYPTYEVTIGIEVHVQLTTATKIFCGCPNQISKDPNTNMCIICTGYPGILPVLNQQVLTYGIMAGLATNCTIASVCSFDRKHYFYPDLPKGYQITQQFQPICTKGFIPINADDGSLKHIRLTRIHIEEDAGKNIHSDTSNESFVDLNRAGTPLLEIVSEPDLSSAYETQQYLKALRSIVQYLGICSGNMEEGAFRADTNISVRKKGATTFGTKCELKNINSFKFISDAIEYEIERQITALEDGESIKQQTRLWDPARKVTVVMRTKEEAADYRYFQDPDLPIIHISDAMIEAIYKQLPELPAQKNNRLQQAYGLTTYEADILIDAPEFADYFERAYNAHNSPTIINWVLRDVMGYIKQHNTSLADCPITPERLAVLVNLISSGTINNRTAQEVFMLIGTEGKDPAVIVKERGLEQIDSTDEIEILIKEFLAANAESVAEYKAGKERLFGFFVGQIMQKTHGKGNPKIIQQLLKKYL
jgi:aspartyl-tRNA(Asn)/glutamyl-tRNA(Gln) amidotransferase subunit B